MIEMQEYELPPQNIFEPVEDEYNRLAHTSMPC